MFVIKNTVNNDYLAGFMFCAKFTNNVEDAYQYNTEKGALKDIHYYGLGDCCEVVEVSSNI